MPTQPDPVADAAGQSEEHASATVKRTSFAFARGVRQEQFHSRIYRAHACGVPNLKVDVEFRVDGEGAHPYTHAETALYAIFGATEQVIAFSKYIIEAHHEGQEMSNLPSTATAAGASAL